MHRLATIAAFAASLSSVSAAGTATIKNFCSFPVSLWAVDALRNPQSPTTIAPGASYSEGYHTLTTGGVSLKLSTGSSLYSGDAITQFEYTLIGGFIWYDGSNVDCQVTNCPFYNYGVYMDTSDPSCPSRTCAPGARCDGFYNLFNDDWNSLACAPSADISMYLCATSPDGAAAPAAPAASPSAAVTSVAAPIASEPSVPSHTAVSAVVDVVSSAVAPTATTTDTAVYRMEALHVPATTLAKKVHARATEVSHAHMRRHAHAHQH